MASRSAVARATVAQSIKGEDEGGTGAREYGSSDEEEKKKSLQRPRSNKLSLNEHVFSQTPYHFRQNIGNSHGGREKKKTELALP